MAQQLKTNHEIVSDKAKNPVTTSEYIKHGNKWLNDAVNEATVEVTKKANKDYVDAELAKKANAADLTALESTVSGKADSSTVAGISDRVTQNTTKTVDLQSQIDALVISGGGDSNPEVVQARTDVSGITHATLKTRIDSEVTDLKSDIDNLATEQTGYLKESLMRYAKIQLLPDITERRYGESNVSIELYSDNSCHLFTNNSYGNVFIKLYDSANSLPDYVEIGKKYTARMDKINDKIEFQVYYYRANGNTYELARVKNEPITFTVPSLAVGLLIRIVVFSNSGGIDETVKPYLTSGIDLQEDIDTLQSEVDNQISQVNEIVTNAVRELSLIANNAINVATEAKNNLNSEVSRSTAADNEISTAIRNETNRASLVENAITGNLETISDRVDSLRISNQNLTGRVSDLEQGGFEIKESFIEHTIDKWLESHPDATTTVEDNSITSEKLAVGVLGCVMPEMFGAVGDGVTDDTAAWQNMINYCKSNGISSIVCSNKTYAIDGTVGIVMNRLNGLNINLRDATLKVMPNDLESYFTLRIFNSRDITIKNGNFVGEREEHTGTTGEMGYGIDIRTSTNVLISKVNFSHYWGDGINIISTQGEKESENISIEYCTFYKNRRQGLSVSSVNVLNVRGCEFIETSGTSPSCGIDFEPNYDNDIIRNAVVDSCYFEKNEGGAIAFVNLKLNPSISVVNCFSEGDKFVVSERSTGSNGIVSVSNCTFQNMGGCVFHIRNHPSNTWLFNVSDVNIYHPSIADTYREFWDNTILINENQNDIGNMSFKEISVVSDETDNNNFFIYSTAKKNDISVEFKNITGTWKPKVFMNGTDNTLQAEDSTKVWKENVASSPYSFGNGGRIYPLVYLRQGSNVINISGITPKMFEVKFVNLTNRTKTINFPNDITDYSGNTSITLDAYKSVKLFIDLDGYIQYV